MLAARFLLALIASSVAAASGFASGADSGLLVYGGRILTNDGRGGTTGALFAKDGRIVAIGTIEALAARPDARGASQIDLRGAVAVPGLQDAHADLEALGASLEDLDLTGVRSYDEVIARVHQRAATLAAGTWIIGRGWDPTSGPNSGEPHHLLLSAATPKHPVCILRSDGHAALVNQAALVAAKLDGVLDTDPKVAGGRVVLGPDRRATGLLLDAALALVEKVMPEVDGDVRARRLLAAQDLLIAQGITCVHDMGTSRATLAALEGLRASGKLALRVACYPDCPTDLRPDPSAAFAALAVVPDENERLSTPGLRIVIDGALGARGAAMLDDYADAPGQRGTLLLSEDELGKRLSAIARAGLQPALEATGDRANRIALDAIERVGVVVPGFRDARARIEGAEVVTPKDWPRFPALGVIPSMQPGCAITEVTWLGLRLGDTRTRSAHAWRALASELGRMALGSGYPLEKPDLLRGLFAARTRPGARPAEETTLGGGEELDGNAALAGFTSGAAFACKQEEHRGRFAAGFGADITVLSVDPTTCNPEELLHARVLLTVIDGRIVFRSGESVGVEVR